MIKGTLSTHVAAGLAVAAMAVFSSLAAGQQDAYTPGDTPYVGAAVGKSISDCSKRALPGQTFSYVPTDENGNPEAVADDRSNVIPYAGTIVPSGSCASENSMQFYGGFDFNQVAGMPVLLGIEIGYVDFLEIRQSGVSYQVTNLQPNTGLSPNPISRFEHDIDSIYYGGRLGYRIFDNKLLLFLKAGIHLWEYQYDIGLNPVVQSELDPRDGITPVGTGTRYAPAGILHPIAFRDTDIFYGLGIQYDIPQATGTMNLRVEWQHFEFEGAVVDMSIDLFTVGIGYNFNI